MAQTTSHILMIRPVRFGFNEQTAESNTFQDPTQKNNLSVQENALKEFDEMTQSLRSLGVDVTIINDTPEPHTPDSIFPNNWVSFHDDGTVFLYPMQAENRRLERRADILSTLKTQGFQIENTIDLSSYEEGNKFLEGTGSMVLDRENKIIYACLSPRTDLVVLTDFAQKAGYEMVKFHSFAGGKAIYHTNVVMSLGEKYCVVCLDSIPDETECKEVESFLVKTGKEIIRISFDQMNHFAGNMLQITNKENDLLVVMSNQAYHSLSEDQVQKLAKHGKLIHPDLNTIETNGGGSARCMIAEVHLPKD